MIQGYVNEKFVPLIRLFVFGTQGQIHEIEAVFDTGYNSFLTLPSDLIDVLGLPKFSEVEVQLADGSRQTALTYLADIMTDKRLFHIEIDPAEGIPLAGMRLFVSYDAALRIEPNGNLSLSEP